MVRKPADLTVFASTIRVPPTHPARYSMDRVAWRAHQLRIHQGMRARPQAYVEAYPARNSKGRQAAATAS